jgi:hypothetical protein
MRRKSLATRSHCTMSKSIYIYGVRSDMAFKYAARFEDRVPISKPTSITMH